MEMAQAGYREVEHTADWELEVWAPNMVSLLEQAARGMYALAGARLSEGSRASRSIQVQAFDQETMLVSFLSELLYLGEMEGLAFDEFPLTLQGDTLKCELQGAPLVSIDKEIKAVTYHNLAVTQSERGLQVNIVFDV